MTTLIGLGGSGGSSNSNITGLRNSYLGQVATRCYPPRNVIAGVRYARTRDYVRTKSRALNPKVGWARWRVASGVENVASLGTCTFIAALEYPAGVYTYSNQNIVAGSVGTPAAVNFPTNSTLILDFAVDIPAESDVFLWVMQDGDGVLFRQDQSPDLAAAGCALDNGTGTRPGLFDVFPGGYSEFSYPPVLFVAQTRQPSVLQFGDSREESNTYGPRPPYYDNGLCIATIAQRFGYASMTESATQLAQFIAGTKTRRVELAQYFSHVLQTFGINDFDAGRTVAQLIADITTFAALFPNQSVVTTTVPPSYATIDGFATRANQTPGAATLAKCREANTAIRKGLVGIKFILDTDMLIDPIQIAKLPVTRNFNDTARPTACTFTGNIAGGSPSVLNVTAISVGSLTYGDPLTDSPTASGPAPTSILAGCTILEQLSGAAGGIGTYRVSRPQPAGLTARTLYVGAYACADGYHLTGPFGDQIKERMTPALQLFV